MKKFKKILASFMAVALVLVALGMPKVAKAEGVIDFYFQNTEGWEKVFCYIWQGSGPVKGTAAWPGAEMTLVEGTDDWYHLEYTQGTAFQVIFNDNGAPKANQTGNLPADIDASETAYWFVIGGGVTEEGTSDGYTQSGLQVGVLTEAPEGFPSVTAVEEVESEVTEEVAESEATLDDSPKTGDSIMPFVAMIAMIGSAGVIVAILIRRKRTITE